MINDGKVDWTKLNESLREKYETKVLNRDDLFRDISLNMKNLDWIGYGDIVTQAYDVFAKEVNRLELAINLFENLLLFEDIRYECEGVGDFVIDIPRRYFRFPANNNIRDQFSFKEFTASEEEKIDSIILESRDAMNLRNDENIVREHFHKLEFLAIFGYFEAFLESLLAEYIWGGSEEEKIKANATIMKKSLPESIKKVISELDTEVENLLLALNPDIFLFLHYCYLVRNVHTHNLGRATKYLILKGKEYGSLRDEEVKNVDGEIIRVDLCTAYRGFAKYKVVKGGYICLSSLVAMFRSYAKEIAYILDKSVKNE